MTAYLGNPGSLVRVECPSVQSKDSQRPARYLNTIGGTTFAQVGPRTKRSWEVRLPATSTPAEVATWQAFVEGEFGNGPWWFVPEVAATTNVMSARGSVLDTSVVQSGSSVNGGPMVLPDGQVAGRSWLVGPLNVFLPWVDDLQFTPVVPGVPVTGSVFVQGAGARFRLRLYRSDGSISRTIGDAYASGSEAQRLSLSVTPREGEALCLLMVDSTQCRVARPAVTWTEDLQPWSVGAGAPKVHIAGMSEDVTLAAPGREMVGASLTVREVG